MAVLRIGVETRLRDLRLSAELAARAGEPLALAGPSGAGKTTVLRVAAGLLRPERGRVSLGEEVWLDTAAGVEVAAERRDCGVVFQDYALFPRLNVWRNVAFGMRGPRRTQRAAALALLERFGVGHLAEARPRSISGGERQRVALARTLAAQPRALLLDEPLAALDPASRRGALVELRSVLTGLALPAIVVTHSFEEAALLAPRLAVIDRGEVIQTGLPAEVSARPCSAFVADFAGASVLHGSAAGESGELTLVRLEGGGEVRSVDAARGAVAVSVFPWEVSLEAPGMGGGDSILNRVPGEVSTVTIVGNRARVGIALPQPLVAEVTAASAERLGLRPGSAVVAAWKAAATRLVPLSSRGSASPRSP